MPSIKDTRHQMVQFVFPEHANIHGTLHGGRLMDWIMLAGSINSSRISRGITVLGATDSIDFINPVKVGDIVMLDSSIEYIGSSSMEIGVTVHSENLETREKKLTTSAHLAFIAVDGDGNPRRINEQIEPADDEKALYEEARKRRDQRIPKIGIRDEQAKNIIDETEITRMRLETTKVVLPEDSFYGSFMSVGKLMLDIDETAAILAMRFVKDVLVTGSLDELFFYSPIKVGDITIFKSGITYVGNSSLEVGIKVLSENILTGEQRHTCTAFLTYVHVGDDGLPKQVPAFSPETPEEKRLWKKAQERKDKRTARLKRIKEIAT
ncbi:MAG TPA: acyl-CoA thioesterase [Thermodesulfobacteriota bacterium]|nr:acyl-CoA thioesterase [Thermodesulfobacteriota bacterium]